MLPTLFDDPQRFELIGRFRGWIGREAYFETRL
jgi:hypothetical protein